MGHPIMPRRFDDAHMLVRGLIFIVSLLGFVTRNNANEGIALPHEVTESFSQVLQPLFRDHCVACHGKGDTTEGEVDLFALRGAGDIITRPELIDDLITVISSGYMPPEDEPPLDLVERQRIVNDLKLILAVAVQTQPTSTRTPIRRMNRLQYNNAVQDLFKLNVEVFPLRERMMRDLGNYFQPASGKMPSQVKVASRPLGKFQIIERHLSGATPFPQDLRAEHGFDNRGDHLTLSPVLMESFVRLSQSIVESPELSAKSSGIWQDFFESPHEAETDTIDVIIWERLRPFLTRAFRRPVEDEVVRRYAQHVRSQLDADVSFTNAMKSAAAAAIASPRFLYLYDLEDAENGEPLDDFNLASRLSFFLWGSIPDEELQSLAASKRLHEPEVLRKQVDRMLRDQRLKRFCDSFPAQWLQLERIISSQPDPQLYPQFYFSKYRASMHMMLEPLLLFETVLIENQSILQLIDSDFSYRSDLLDAWYRDGSQGNAGPPTQVVLRRVPVTDRRQGGVITTAAVLTMTSGPHRTKPISRGAWLATVILNDPPPPPPADVPPLADKPSQDEDKLTVRERFVAHRKEAACAGCHQRIDPLGFALENYDAAGIWRETYDNGRSVDASGRLFGKYEFQDIVGFKDALLAEKDRFARAFAAHLLSYASGRAITAEDSPELDKIVFESAADDYRIQTLIQQVVLSDSFRR